MSSAEQEQRKHCDDRGSDVHQDKLAPELESLASLFAKYPPRSTGEFAAYNIFKARAHNTFVDKAKSVCAWLLQPRETDLTCECLLRPHRFGKTFFLDTVQSIYEGRKELFVGTSFEHEWDWSRLPSKVIRIDMKRLLVPLIMPYMPLESEEAEVSTARPLYAPTERDDLLKSLDQRDSKYVDPFLVNLYACIYEECAQGSFDQGRAAIWPILRSSIQQDLDASSGLAVIDGDDSLNAERSARDPEKCGENFAACLGQTTQSSFFWQLKTLLNTCAPHSRVLLIDDFDYPLLSCMTHWELYNVRARYLNVFLSVLSACISRFSRIVITGSMGFQQYDGPLRNPRMSPMPYSNPFVGPVLGNVCGFTSAELEQQFAAKLDETCKLLNEHLQSSQEAKEEANESVAQLQASQGQSAENESSVPNAYSRESLLAMLQRRYGGYCFGAVEKLLHPAECLAFFADPVSALYPYQCCYSPYFLSEPYLRRCVGDNSIYFFDQLSELLLGNGIFTRPESNTSLGGSYIRPWYEQQVSLIGETSTPLRLHVFEEGLGMWDWSDGFVGFDFDTPDVDLHQLMDMDLPLRIKIRDDASVEQDQDTLEAAQSAEMAVLPYHLMPRLPFFKTNLFDTTFSVLSSLGFAPSRDEYMDYMGLFTSMGMYKPKLPVNLLQKALNIREFLNLLTRTSGAPEVKPIFSESEWNSFPQLFRHALETQFKLKIIEQVKEDEENSAQQDKLAGTIDLRTRSLKQRKANLATLRSRGRRIVASVYRAYAVYRDRTDLTNQAQCEELAAMQIALRRFEGVKVAFAELTASLPHWFEEDSAEGLEDSEQGKAPDRSPAPQAVDAEAAAAAPSVAAGFGDVVAAGAGAAKIEDAAKAKDVAAVPVQLAETREAEDERAVQNASAQMPYIIKSLRASLRDQLSEFAQAKKLKELRKRMLQQKTKNAESKATPFEESTSGLIISEALQARPERAAEASDESLHPSSKLHLGTDAQVSSAEDRAKAPHSQSSKARSVRPLLSVFIDDDGNTKLQSYFDDYAKDVASSSGFFAAFGSDKGEDVASEHGGEQVAKGTQGALAGGYTDAFGALYSVDYSLPHLPMSADNMWIESLRALPFEQLLPVIYAASLTAQDVLEEVLRSALSFLVFQNAMSVDANGRFYSDFPSSNLTAEWSQVPYPAAEIGLRVELPSSDGSGELSGAPRVAAKQDDDEAVSEWYLRRTSLPTVSLWARNKRLKNVGDCIDSSLAWEQLPPEERARSVRALLQLGECNGLRRVFTCSNFARVVISLDQIRRVITHRLAQACYLALGTKTQLCRLLPSTKSLREQCYGEVHLYQVLQGIGLVQVERLSEKLCMAQLVNEDSAYELKQFIKSHYFTQKCEGQPLTFVAACTRSLDFWYSKNLLKQVAPLFDAILQTFAWQQASTEVNANYICQVFKLWLVSHLKQEWIDSGRIRIFTEPVEPPLPSLVASRMAEHYARHWGLELDDSISKFFPEFYPQPHHNLTVVMDDSEALVFEVALVNTFDSVPVAVNFSTKRLNDASQPVAAVQGLHPSDSLVSSIKTVKRVVLVVARDLGDYGNCYRVVHCAKGKTTSKAKYRE